MADKPVRTDKATAVAELTEQFRSSTATVLTEYRGLTVAQLKSLRRRWAPTPRYAVAKNTLAKRRGRGRGHHRPRRPVLRSDRARLRLR